jgi:hypothetical protein
MASWSTASWLSKPEDVAELRVLFEGDKSDVDDEESRVIAVKRSTSTLDAVKSKFQKHLSRESVMSKHRPRSTVGNSDEEIQRRKELRLIRDRRIKEELSTKGAYDDGDAKSLSTVATENSPYRKPWSRISSEDMGSSEPLEAFTSPSLSMRKSADGIHILKPSASSAIQGRHSIAVVDSPKVSTRTAADWAVRRTSLDFPIPPAPLLKPQRLPSIVDSATRRTSWRLSFASNQRATQLRSLCHEYEPSSSAGSRARGTLVGPLKGFRGQVTRPPPFTTANIPDCFNVPDGPLLQAVCSPTLDNYQSVDSNAELVMTPISLRDMRISQRLAPRGVHSHSSSPQFSSCDTQSHYRNHSYNGEASYQDITSQPKHHQSAFNSGISETKLSTCWGDVLRDSISSIYASTDKCAKPVSDSSRFISSSLLAADKEQASFPSVNSQGKLSLSVRWKWFTDFVGNPTVFQALPIIATIVQAVETKPSTDSDSASSVRHDRRCTMDNSILASETLSFREREAELAAIEARFPRAMKNYNNYPLFGANSMKNLANGRCQCQLSPERSRLFPCSCKYLGLLNWFLKAMMVPVLLSSKFQAGKDLDMPFRIGAILLLAQ